jgi:hypothetical protein
METLRNLLVLPPGSACMTGLPGRVGGWGIAQPVRRHDRPLPASEKKAVSS